MSLIKVQELAHVAGIMTLAVLFGLAYGLIGYYFAKAVAAFNRPPWVFDVTLLAWVAAGSVAITVWTIRWTGIDVRGGVR